MLRTSRSLHARAGDVAAARVRRLTGHWLAQSYRVGRCALPEMVAVRVKHLPLITAVQVCREPPLGRSPANAAPPNSQLECQPSATIRRLFHHREIRLARNSNPDFAAHAGSGISCRIADFKSMFPAIGHRAALSERAALIASRGNAEERRMMVKLDASKSGSFKIGGDIGIHRLGFGAMRIAGPRVWGPP